MVFGKKKSKIEYLAIPYTHEDPRVKEFRAEVSNMIATELSKTGRIIFAPISAWHHIAVKYGLPGNFEYWLELDRQFIRASCRLLVITLPGWEESHGVQEEIKIAKEYKIPIEYIDPQPYIKNIKGAI